MGQFKLCEKKEKILQIPLDFFREFGIIMAVTRNESFLVGQKAVLCTGSTADSDSVCLGSNPGTAAKPGKGLEPIEPQALLFLQLVNWQCLPVPSRCGSAW